MCRLSAITSSNIRPEMKRLIFNQLMMLSCAHDGQFDGAGVTDGLNIYKSRMSYFYQGPSWIQSLSPDHVWMGHVRSASSRTEISNAAAHPYAFPVNDGEQWLIAAHNGTIRGTREPRADEPVVDSYRAFDGLKDLIQYTRSTDITPELINTWTSTFGIDSEWTFMLMLEPDVLHIVRGNRTMFFMPFGNGYIFNTAKPVLVNLKSWLVTYWGQEYHGGKIEEVKENTLLQTSFGTDVYRAQKISGSPQAAAVDEGKYLRVSRSGVTVIRS